MFLEMLLHIGVALFAAFGILCALQLLIELLFDTGRVAGAIEVRSPDDAASLDLLLHEARVTLRGRGATRLVVLISTELMDGTLGVGDEPSDECLALLERYDADCYLIEFD